MYGDLTNEQIEEVLHKQVVGRIGCFADGEMYVVPISYVYDGTYVYGHTMEGMKIHMMRKNPAVCFEVDALENMSNWKSVIAWGEYQELKDPEAKKEALKKLHDKIIPEISTDTSKLSPEWPFIPNDLSTVKGVVFRLKITRKTGKYESGSVPSFLGWG